MKDPKAELSSMTSAVEDITERISRLADELLSAERHDIAHELMEVERSLESAKRRLNALLR